MNVHGIHHVTAIAGNAQENLDFYTGVMGLRLVKKSVNQDAIDTYHLFYADAAGTPGTDLTFFPWPAMGAVRPGVGLAMEVVFAIGPASVEYWTARLAQAGVGPLAPQTRFGEPVLAFHDPHGLPLAHVATEARRPFVPWPASPVPVEHQLHGMHSVRLWERAFAPTERVLLDLLGFSLAGEEEGWRRYRVEGGTPGTIVDVHQRPDGPRGAWGTGAVHHVAWRAGDVAEEMRLRASIESAGIQATPLIDRFWFQSVYFREPGGVLFELATDGPGFARDEDSERLGERLILPPWLEPRRAEIEAGLPQLSIKARVG